MGWKSKKDGTHFNTDKTVRSSEPGTEVNLEIDNNSEEFSEGIRKDFEDFDERHGWELGTAKRNTQQSMKDRFPILTDSAQLKVKKFLKGRDYSDLDDDETYQLSHIQAGLPTDDFKWLARYKQSKHNS